MLKNVKNNIDLIRHEGEEECGCSVSACQAGVQPDIDTANEEIANAEAREKEYDEALENLEKQQKEIEDIAGEYGDFIKEVDGAWMGETDLNGYGDINKDMDCLKQYGAAIAKARIDLQLEKDKWTRQKEKWQDKLAEAQAKYDACSACDCP